MGQINRMDPNAIPRVAMRWTRQGRGKEVDETDVEKISGKRTEIGCMDLELYPTFGS